MGRKTQRCPECKGSKVLTSTTLRIEANEQARREGRRLPPTPFSGRPSWRKYYPACPICDGRGRIPLRIYTIRVQRLEHTNYPPQGSPLSRSSRKMLGWSLGTQHLAPTGCHSA